MSGITPSILPVRLSTKSRQSESGFGRIFSRHIPTPSGHRMASTNAPITRASHATAGDIHLALALPRRTGATDTTWAAQARPIRILGWEDLFRSTIPKLRERL